MAAQKIISELIDVDSFKNLKHLVYMHNDTSLTEVIDPKRLAIIEFLDTGIVLVMPKNSCQTSHMLTIYILDSELKRKIKRLPTNGKEIPGSFTAMGKVVRVDAFENDDTKICVRVDFTQYNESKFQKIIEQYNAKQSDANDVCRMARY